MRDRLISAVLLAAALAVPAAGAEPMRTGAAAFGDWHTDAPGVVRRITAADLPPPHATTSASHLSSSARWPEGVVPKVPAGFTATLFAAGLHGPRTLRTAPDGGVFVAETRPGRVLRLSPDGRATVFASGLDAPYGIAFWPPAAPRYVYVAATDQLVRYPWSPGATEAAGPPETILAGLPTGGHFAHDIAAAADGSRLFLALGSLTNDASGMDAAPPGGVGAWQAAHGVGAAWDDDAGRAALVTLDPLGHALHPYAQGLRNCAGLALDPASGRPWCATNERDGLGDNLPPDYVTAVADGGFYGWPWYYSGAQPDPNHAGERPELAAGVTVPDVLIQPHSAPLGIAFYTGTLFPAAYRGDAFVTLHGSWNRARGTGYKVVRVPMRGGRAVGSYEDFITGFVQSDDAVWGRPVGITVAADGALLVSDDAGGTIWRIAPAR